MTKCWKCGAEMMVTFMGKDLGEQLKQLLNRVTVLEELRVPGSREAQLEREVAKLTLSLYQAEQRIERLKAALK